VRVNYTMTEYIDHRSGEKMVQTSVYIEEWLREWARDNDIKMGKTLSTCLKAKKEKVDNAK